MPATTLHTERLLLRQWRQEDFAPFAAMNADVEVMRYFPRTFTRETSDKQASVLQSFIEKRGWGFWAVELKSGGEFIGFVGLNEPNYQLPFPPCIEIGWRLARQYWGKGYATEAAVESLRFAFNELRLDEVAAFTATINLPSKKVIQRLGMVNTGNNFFHPQVETGSILAEHVLYKINRHHWSGLYEK